MLGAAVGEKMLNVDTLTVVDGLQRLSARTGIPLLPAPTSHLIAQGAWQQQNAHNFNVLSPFELGRFALGSAALPPAPVVSRRFERVVDHLHRAARYREALYGHQLVQLDRWHSTHCFNEADCGARWSPWLVAVGAEVSRLAEDADFFLVAHRVGSVLHAMCLDDSLVRETTVAKSIEVAVDSQKASLGETICGASVWWHHSGSAPPSICLLGAISWGEGYAFLLAIVCFVFEDAEESFAACCVMHDRYFRYFHAPMCTAAGLGVAMTALQHELMFDPDICDHFEAIGIDLLLEVAATWFSTWFAGFVPLSQALLIFDFAILSPHDAAVENDRVSSAARALASVASGVLALRRSAILVAGDREELLDLCFDLGDVDVLPLLAGSGGCAVYDCEMLLKTVFCAWFHRSVVMDCAVASQQQWRLYGKRTSS